MNAHDVIKTIVSSGRILSQTVETIIDSPTVAIGVPAAVVTIGLADIQNWLATISMFIGVIVALVLLNNHLIKRRILIEQERLLRKHGTLDGSVDT